MTSIEQKQLSQTQDQIRWLYQKYAPSLLGYIYGMIQDRQESEEYLVKILSRFAVDYEEEIVNLRINWPKLLQYSRNLIPELQALSQGTRIGKAEPKAITQFDQLELSVLSNDEKQIFCAIYYHGKSISDLAKVLKESEQVIRSQFKLSFDKIRRARGN
jgi:DNA-directed RNA polymerase specialized sigma24 family protein